MESPIIVIRRIQIGANISSTAYTMEAIGNTTDSHINMIVAECRIDYDRFTEVFTDTVKEISQTNKVLYMFHLNRNVIKTCISLNQFKKRKILAHKG